MTGARLASELAKVTVPMLAARLRGIRKGVLPQTRIYERGGRPRTTTALSIAAVLDAGHPGWL
jgi:hypothetical protein